MGILWILKTVDHEFKLATLDFMTRAVDQGKPFFVWFNTTRMHFFTHTADDELGLSGQGFYNDAMVGHDLMVGELLDHLDKLGVADNTIVMYSTDNGPHYNTWPDAAITPFQRWSAGPAVSQRDRLLTRSCLTRIGCQL